MIKCEVSFTNSMIELNGYQMIQDMSFYEWNIYKEDLFVECFEYIEEAIKYCLEN